MIDLFCLVVSLGLTAMVVLQAIRLNRDLEWFPRPSDKPRPAQREKAPQGAGVLAIRPQRGVRR